jgi:hypothetical protein
MPRTAKLSIRMAEETREQLEATAEAHGDKRSQDRDIAIALDLARGL